MTSESIETYFYLSATPKLQGKTLNARLADASRTGWHEGDIVCSLSLKITSVNCEPPE